MAKTIEERAEKKYKLRPWMSKMMQVSVKINKLRYIQIATEQDRIARAEERERCIKAAQDAHCNMCAIYEVCHNLSGGNLDGECKAKEIIRKAMEGGNNGND